MDTERALEAIRDLRGTSEAMEQRENFYRTTGPSYGFLDDHSWKGQKARADSLIGPCVRLAAEVDPDLATRLRSAHTTGEQYRVQSVCNEIEGRLITDAEIDEIIGPKGPKLAAADLHPWIWNAAVNLWDDGHHREAVQTAATALFDSHLPAKLGRPRDTNGGKDLAGQAFTTKDPEPGAPRLRIPGYDKTTSPKDWTSAHEGAMYLGQGAAQYIRNLTTHNTAQLDDQQALEMLATLSLFARIVDQATVESAK